METSAAPPVRARFDELTPVAGRDFAHSRVYVDRRPSDSTSLGMNVVAAGSGSVNDTRRRPATVAVAVCIGSYARIIFVDG